LSLVNPPWFDAQLNEAGRDYYQSAGFGVLYAQPCRLPSSQHQITPGHLYSWIVESVPEASEALVIGGNGFRAVGVIDALESHLGKPVLSANQALFGAALKAAGETPGTVKGYGRIFSL
jgi:maleate isomerase